MRNSKKFIAILLAALMAISMMPFTAFAADEPYAALKNTTTAITFDNKQWYLIDYDDSTVTLLAKECVGASKFGTNQTYSGSTVETFVNTWYTNNITGDAKTAVNENGMFLLTTDQANATTADVKKCSRVDGTGGNYWWLCSPGNNQFRAARVNGDNGDVNGDGWNITYVFGVRPALKLDLSKVEFNSETNTFAEPALDSVSYKNAAYDSATNTVTYTDATCDDYTVVAADTTTFEDGKWYVVNSNVTVNGSITVNGAANLILADGYTLTVTEGVAVTDPSSLTIFGQENGTGTLTATGGSYGVAGIGGNNAENGPITINGGTVNATGGESAAGIGGGSMGNGGAVVINGGTVTATATEDGGAGIGGGDNSETCDVTINGGTVNAATLATNYSTNAGIGTSGWSANGGSVAINGGTVNAVGTPGGQGIGGAGCTINITGGTVNINNGAASIDCALRGSSATISGGTVFATGKAAVDVSNTTITGGTIVLESSISHNPAIIGNTVSIGTGLKVLAGSNEANAVSVSPSFVNPNSSDYYTAGAATWLKIYPAPAEPETPTATVTPLTEAQLTNQPTFMVGASTATNITYDVGYEFTANDDATSVQESAYKDYAADFVISSDTDLPAGSVILGGNYGEYGWVGLTNAETITAGTEVKLLDLLRDDPVTYETICTEVSPFKCAIKGNDPSVIGAEITVELRIYAPTETGYEAEGTPVADFTEEVEYNDTVMPQAIVTALEPAAITEQSTLMVGDSTAQDITYDFGYRFEAPHDATSVQYSTYKDYAADFVISSDTDLPAGSVILGGNYGEYGWVGLTNAETITAGTEVKLLDLLRDDPVTYATICTEVSPFLCAVKCNSEEADGANITVELRIYAPTETGYEAEGTPVGDFTEELEYTPEKVYNNGANFTLNGSINTNVYLDKDYPASYTAEITYNHNSNIAEEADVRTDIVSLGDLTKYSKSGDPFDGSYLFTVKQAPAQLSESILITLKDAADAVVDELVVTPSVICRTQADATTGALQNLYKSIVDYAKAAQLYFNYNTTAPVATDFYNDVNAATIPSTGGSSSLTTFAGVSMVVTSDLGVNIYTNELPTGVSISGPAGVTAQAGENGGRYFIAIRNISAADLDTNFTVTTDQGTITLSAYTVARSVVAGSNNAAYQTLARAMYLYGAAADAYFV